MMSGAPSSAELAVFDFDGTLADSARWFFSTVDELAVRYRFKRTSEEEIEVLRGKSTREILAYLGISWWKVPLLAREMRRRSQASAGSLPLFDGAAEMLATLAERGVTLAILTSNAEATVRAVLGPSASLVRYFACGASLLGKHRKLAQLLREAGVPAARAVCIGDEMRDIDAARRIGARTIAVSWGFATAEALRAHRPDHLVEQMSALPALIAPR